MSSIDAAITSDQKADRQAENPSVTFRKPGVAESDRVIHFESLVKRTHGSSVVVEGNTDDSKTAIPILVLQIHELRNLTAARRAPRRPEVEQHHLAPIGGEINLVTVQVGERKLRGDRMADYRVSTRKGRRLFHLRPRGTRAQRQSGRQAQKD
jgi:hypothetical protein